MKPTDELENWSPTEPPFSPETIIEDIICSYPSQLIRQTFDELNLHCFNCVVGPEDSLRDVARLHDLEEEELVRALSGCLSGQQTLAEPSYHE